MRLQSSDSSDDAKERCRLIVAKLTVLRSCWEFNRRALSGLASPDLKSGPLAYCPAARSQLVKLLRDDSSSAFRPVAGAVSSDRDVCQRQRGAAAAGFRAPDDFARRGSGSYTV